jgi:hypothetical protein
MGLGLGLGLGVRRKRAAAFSPATLSGLVALYTASPTYCFSDAAGTVPCGAGDGVWVWKDRSGGARDLAQATAASQPKLQQVGGKWVVRFDGTDDLIDRAHTQVGTTGQAYFYRGILNAAGNFPMVLVNRNNSREFRFSGTLRRLETLRNGGSVTGATAVALATSFTGMASHNYVADTCEVFLNGVSDATGPDIMDAVSTPADLIRLGARSAGSFHWSGDLYEIGYLERPLTAAEVAQLHAYLAAL